MSGAFPIHPYSMREEKWFPRSVPWGRIAHSEARAQKNHGQSLDQLALRGGLSPDELWAAYHDKDLGEVRKMSLRDHLAALELVIQLNEEDSHGE